MTAIEKPSIFNRLHSIFSLSLFPSGRFNWLLLCSCIPLALGSISTVSIAAPEPNYQVIVKGKVSRPTLKAGSKGEFVSELQAALKLLDFYPGEVDGVYGESTANAVFSFQMAAGLNPNGIVDAGTWQTLFPIPSTEETPGSNDNSVNNFPRPTQIFNNRISNNQISSSQISNNQTSNNQTSNNQTSNNQTSINQTSNNTTVIRTTTEPTPTIPERSRTQKKPKPKPVQKPQSQRQSSTSRPRSKPPSSQTTSSPKKPAIQYTAQGFPILRLGMRGSEVLKLQKDLQKLGFLKTGIDGDFGTLTETAVKALQKRYGLEADGVVGGGTWQIINKQIKR